MTTEPVAVTETRLLHEVHRQATVVLVDAARRPGTHVGALAELRDFVVATLRRHHKSDHRVPWLSTTAAGCTSPATRRSLTTRSGRPAPGSARLAGATRSG